MQRNQLHKNILKGIAMHITMCLILCFCVSSIAWAGSIANVALNRPVSFVYKGPLPHDTSRANPNNVNDGSTLTWLLVDGLGVGGGDNRGSFLTYSLQQPESLVSLIVKQPFDSHNPSIRVRGYTISVSQDSIQWTVIISQAQNVSPQIDTTFPSVAVAKYLRLTVTDVDTGATQTVISECEVYARANHPTGAVTSFASGPLSFGLEQNYPNPFNPATTFRFSLPRDGQVRLGIYNILGEFLGFIVDDRCAAGEHVVPWNASHLSSGLYYYRMESDNYIKTMKMLLVK